MIHRNCTLINDLFFQYFRLVEVTIGILLVVIIVCEGFSIITITNHRIATNVPILSRTTTRYSTFLPVMPSNFFAEPDNTQSSFGRRDYWNQFYKNQSDSHFSWYAGWEDLQPFIQEFVSVSHKVLLPGVGNDAMLADMYDAGYTQLTAMDYSSEGIARCREMLGDSCQRLSSPTDQEGSQEGVILIVADARDLGNVFEPYSFDAIIEKGTLDAIFLSGGSNKTLSQQNLNLAISELGRCIKPGGIWISVAAVVDQQIQSLFDSRPEWNCLVQRDQLFVTEDGYTSNNIDGSLLVWQKR